MTGTDHKAAAQYAVLFDCDGVLINSEEIAEEFNRAYLAREYGLHYTQEEYTSRFIGRTYDHFIAQVQADHLAVHGTPMPDDFERKIDDEYQILMKTRLRQIPEVRRLLSKLQGARIPFAVCTNASLAGTLDKLARVGLRDYFGPHIYSKDMVLRPKPAPDVYLLGARALGVPPERCFVIEDSVTGVTAGVAAGATVIGYTGGGHRSENYGQDLRRAGAAYATNSMNNAGTFILNRVLSRRAQFGPQYG